jgi:hypothetical protein
VIEQLRAHGFDPGPSQRPRIAGFIAAGASAPIALFVFARCGDLRSPAMVALAALVLLFEGVLYGQIFRRAANDRRGGWMFGMSFGFAVWTATVALLRASSTHPTGLAAMGLFAGFVTHGALVGLIFPWIHTLIMRRLTSPVRAERARGGGARAQGWRAEPRAAGRL